MIVDHLPETEESFLSSYEPPPLRFGPAPHLKEPIRSVWAAMSSDSYSRASERALEAISGSSSAPAPDRAACYALLAAATQAAGNRRRALAAAEESVRLHSQQWLAHRVIARIYWHDGDFENGYFYLSTLLEPRTTLPWDLPLSSGDKHLAIAAMAWRLQDWDGVRDHLARAYPEGVASMPVSLREDAFRVAVYRDAPADAADVAASLLPVYRIEDIDRMLKTMDVRGWPDHALALYRDAYVAHPESELLRRRLVGLCVRQGCVDEARLLTDGSALDLAA